MHRLSVRHDLFIAQVHLADGLDLDGRCVGVDLVVVGLARSCLTDLGSLGDGGFRVCHRLLLAAEEFLPDVAFDPLGALVVSWVEVLVRDVDEAVVLEAEEVEEVPEDLLVHLVRQVVSFFLPLVPEGILFPDEGDLGLAQLHRQEPALRCATLLSHSFLFDLIYQ